MNMEKIAFNVQSCTTHHLVYKRPDMSLSMSIERPFGAISEICYSKYAKRRTYSFNQIDAMTDQRHMKESAFL